MGDDLARVVLRRWWVVMGDRGVGPKGRILGLYKSGRDARHTSLDPFQAFSHHV